MPGHDSSAVDMSEEAVAARLRAVSNLCKLGLSIQRARAMSDAQARDADGSSSPSLQVPDEMQVDADRAEPQH